MLVGVHTHVYASGDETNVDCLSLPPLDCLKTQDLSVDRLGALASQRSASHCLCLPMLQGLQVRLWAYSAFYIDAGGSKASPVLLCGQSQQSCPLSHFSSLYFIYFLRQNLM